MDKYDTKMLRNESLLILITSTFGNGEAPDNGKVANTTSSLHTQIFVAVTYNLIWLNYNDLLFFLYKSLVMCCIMLFACYLSPQ